MVLSMPKTQSPKNGRKGLHKDLACLSTDRCCSMLVAAANDPGDPKQWMTDDTYKSDTITVRHSQLTIFHTAERVQ